MLGRALTVILAIYSMAIVAIFTGIIAGFHVEVVKHKSNERLMEFLERLTDLPDMSKEELTELAQRARELTDGKIYGSIEDGVWKYRYDNLGDLELRTVKGVEVRLDPDHTGRASTNTFFFDPPKDGETAVVQASSGLLFATIDRFYTDDRVIVSHEETEYEGLRAYDIKANGSIIVFFPVKYETTELYHIVNDVPVKVSSVPMDDGRQTYLMAELTSFSRYYLTEPPAPSDSSRAYDALMILIVVVVFAVPLLAKRRMS